MTPAPICRSRPSHLNQYIMADKVCKQLLGNEFFVPKWVRFRELWSLQSQWEVSEDSSCQNMVRKWPVTNEFNQPKLRSHCSLVFRSWLECIVTSCVGSECVDNSCRQPTGGDLPDRKWEIRTFHVWMLGIRPPLCSSDQSSWLLTQRPWVRLPALPNFLRSSGSGTGSTQPRDDKWGATWKKR
jgi:hypothetical protein